MLKTILSKYTQLIRYFFVGGTAALVEWFVFYIVCYLSALHYSAGVTAAFFIATFVNFMLGRHFVFRQRSHSFLRELFFVYTASAAGLPLNLLLMWVQISLLGLFPMAAKIISTGLVFVWNYLSRRYFIYQPGRRKGL